MKNYSLEQTKKIYERITKSASGVGDIEVRINRYGSTCYFNPEDNQIVMPYTINEAENDAEDFFLGKGFLIHEVSHLLFAPSNKYPDGINHRGFGGTQFAREQMFKQLLNIFADVNNEWKISELFPHFKELLKEKTVKIIKKNKLETTPNPILQLLMRVDKLVEAELSPEFNEETHEDIKKLIEETVKEFKKRGIINTDEQGLRDFAEWACGKWVDKQGEFNQKIQKLSKKIGKLRKKSMELLTKGKDGKFSKTKKEVTKLEKELKKLRDCDILCGNEKLSVDLISEDLTDESGLKSDQDLDKAMNELKPEKQENIKKVQKKLFNDLPEIEVLEKGNNDSPTSYNDYDVEKSEKIGRKIKQELLKKLELKKDFQKKRRSGRIDIQRLRDQIGKNGRVISGKLFQKKIDWNQGTEFALSVLIDCSGSMTRGRKLESAKEALLTLDSAFNDLPGIKYEVRAFTSYMMKPVEIPLKKFEWSGIDREKLQSLSPECGNEEGFNIRKAAQRLVKFRDRPKLIVVISDGLPAYTYKNKEGEEDVKLLSEKLRKVGINLVGIGIECANKKKVEEMYSEHAFFENTENLVGELARLILSNLKKRPKISMQRTVW